MYAIRSYYALLPDGYNRCVHPGVVKFRACGARLARAAVCVLALMGCTPQQQLLMSLIPDGTFPILLSHLESTSDTNRRRLAELDAHGDWKEMVAFAQENLARDPSNSDWWMIKGYAYTRLNEHRQAAECYSYNFV